MITIVASGRANHQIQHQKALAAGLKTYGIESKLSGSISDVYTDYVACWGWRNGKLLREAGKEVLVMERGYIGDRFKYTSLAWNGLNGHAEFPEYEYDGGKRFKELGVDIKPWKKNGVYALILGQVPNDASLQGRDIQPWYEEVALYIKENFNIPVLYRSHPDVVNRGQREVIKDTVPSTGSLQEALSGALFTVCYNSNSSVDSVLAGIPCVVEDKGTMAYEVCSKNVEKIEYPERELWAHKLAQKQWRMDEIESGEALKGIVCKLGVLSPQDSL